jgi:hypothetical protein
VSAVRTTLRALTAWLVVMMVPLLGCSADREATPSKSNDAVASAASRTDPKIEKARREAFEKKELERVAPGAETAVIGEIPAELLEQIFADLESRSGRERTEFTVVRSMAMIWPNGALGCPEPGMVYPQATVPGYWAVLELDGKQYDYRASERGFITLCDHAVMTAPAR